MYRYYENQQDGHYKFYEVEGPLPRLSKEKLLYVIDTWRGTIGAQGTWIVYAYPTKVAAHAGLQAIHEERLRHGYQALKDGQTWQEVTQCQAAQLELFA